MKYLKLFENYDDPLVTKISLDDYQMRTSGFDVDIERPDSYYDDFVKDNWESFDERETQLIKTIIPTSFRYKFNVGHDYIENCPKGEIYIMKSNILRMIITKLKDEWFYIYDVDDEREDRVICFKCDQIDGLEDYLKNTKF